MNESVITPPPQILSENADGQWGRGWMEWRVMCGKWDTKVEGIDAESEQLKENRRRSQTEMNSL